MAGKKPSVLALIPARGGSKRIRGKNIRPFAGKSLVARTIEQAKKLSFVDTIIVDTDSPDIASIAKRAGADVPYLRPKQLASNSARIIDSIQYLLTFLSSERKYRPDFVLILQPTSPLREVDDIIECWKLMKKGGATTVLTVAPTHPRLYHRDRSGFIHLVNGSEAQSTNMQEWPDAYLLNGCFAYVVNTSALLKEKRIITKKTKAVVSPKWRSIDLDTPEDWVLAELVFQNRTSIAKKVRAFK